MIDVLGFRDFMTHVEAKRGPFVLFALFHSEESGMWHLAVSAPWLEHDQWEALDEVINGVCKFFRVKHIGLVSLSGVAIYRKKDPALKAILEETSLVPNRLDWRGTSLFDLPIDHAYILKAQAPARTTRKEAAAVDDHRRTRPRSRSTAKRPAPSRK